MKTQVEDINRNIYDIKNKDDYEIKIQGLNREIVEEISRLKNEPDWMLEIRLKALKMYEELALPTWGPDLSELNMDDIATYVKPKSKLNSSWEDVPEDIKNTFDKLGIPEAEKKSLAGVGAQYDSEVVYHSMKEDLIKQGVIYTDMESAVRDYPEIVKKHFMKCVPISDHKFVALHAAVWSGGSFVYVPKGVKLDFPLQSYFRLNSPESGQFEHTLIIVDEGASLHFIEGCSAPKYNKVNLHAGCVELYVKDNAYLRYSTIENWSKNMMNLNTKKAIVGKNAQMDWVTGSFGSKVSMLYPMSILNGQGSKTEYTGITFAGGGQNLDTGFKVIHNAPNTSSVINSKSISKDGGACTYRSLVRINENAKNSKCSVSCESLMLDEISKSDTIPVNDIRTDEVEFSHEAKIGKISDKTIFYLMSRGLSEEDAKAMIVRGFAYPISKELPVEYAVEMNNLINLELEGLLDNMEKLKLNNTPVRTARNFAINNIEVLFEMPKEIRKFKNVEIINDKSIIDNEVSNKELTYGTGKILEKLIFEEANNKIRIQTTKPKEDIKIIYNFDDNNLNLINQIEIIANNDTNVTIIYKSKTSRTCFHNGIIRTTAKENVQLNVTIVNMLNENTDNFEAIENTLYQNSNVKYTIIDIGGKTSVSNYYSNIIGTNASNDLKTIYLGRNNQIKDINYIAELKGEKTNIDIDVQGALKDEAKKNFKGTIDFKRGCKKAKGNENENCMLLSNKAKSIALPMLLCTEEDVEGNHSTSSGKVDEKQLFYIMARGISYKEAVKLIVKSKFNNIIEKIKDDNLKEEILKEIDERLD